MIKVLIVDDSPVVREFLTHILESDPDIRVIGYACDGMEAVKAVKEKIPDVVTMDIHMPEMDGFKATRIIMETAPVPIVIVTASFDPGEVAKTFRALEAGALAIVARPTGIGHPDHENGKRVLIRHVKAMSQVRLVRRRPQAPRRERFSLAPAGAIRHETPEVKVVAIGASTGGPAVIQRILAALPRDFPAPVLIVQHMAGGFIAGFAAWLAQTTGIQAKVADHGEQARSGCAYIAPDGFDMGVEKDGRITLKRGDNHGNHCPSVSHLFRSVAESFGETAMGILLTGMGKDGADDLLTMRQRGALTMAQDEASSIVFGMPGAAAGLDAATLVLPPDSIAEVLKRVVRGIGGSRDER